MTADRNVDPKEIPLFLDYVHGNIARQINKLRGRTGTFWSRRGAVIAVIDERAQLARFRYIVAQGTAAGLVVSPKEWPGASSTAALLGDMRVTATYTSLDAARRNAQRAKPRPPLLRVAADRKVLLGTQPRGRPADIGVSARGGRGERRRRVWLIGSGGT